MFQVTFHHWFWNVVHSFPSCHKTETRKPRDPRRVFPACMVIIYFVPGNRRGVTVLSPKTSYSLSCMEINFLALRRRKHLHYSRFRRGPVCSGWRNPKLTVEC